VSKADSIKAKLKNLAVLEKKPYDYMLTMYCMERLIYRLSVSKYANNFVLKGGLFLYALLDEEARMTKDVDLLALQISNSIDNILKIFEEILSFEADDGLMFKDEAIRSEQIREDADYEGIRIKFDAYLDRTKIALPIDIGFGDIVSPDVQIISYPALLTDERILIRAYSFESVVAEKFEAMVSLAQANSRMKDFYDIYQLSRLFDFEGSILKEAILLTFKRRKTVFQNEPIVFQNGFVRSLEKVAQWTGFLKRIEADSSLEFQTVIENNRIFLEPVYLAILANEPFFCRWKKEKREWVGLD